MVSNASSASAGFETRIVASTSSSSGRLDHQRDWQSQPWQPGAGGARQHRLLHRTAARNRPRWPPPCRRPWRSGGALLGARARGGGDEAHEAWREAHAEHEESSAREQARDSQLSTLKSQVSSLKRREKRDVCRIEGCTRSE
eukprot:scaffold7419_cov137-Isochrysis_galbana.AAC.4